jgi:hypothetical protein
VHDPKYTVVPQRERLNRRRAAEAADAPAGTTHHGTDADKENL